ncbi:MAG: PepSY-associated TM helix domain-containing protein [Pseudomonadota bacterium]
MIGTFRQSMTWLHTWAGLVFCWILYFMFVTGTLGYFDTEIDHWMQPELSQLEETTTETRIDTAVRYLEANAQGAERWFINFGGGREEPHLRVFWQTPSVDEDAPPENNNVLLDAATGKPLDEVARDTGGGQLLYRMHYVLHYLDPQVGFRLVGILTLFMFIGLVTGIIAHKKIFKDFFTFRPKKGQRSWLDMHNLLSVSSLPFQLMITYSGLLFATALYMPLIAFGSVGFNSEKAAELGNFLNVEVEASGIAAPVGDIAGVVADVEADWGRGSVERLNIYQPGDAYARVVLAPTAELGFLQGSRIYNATTGEYLRDQQIPDSGALSFASVMLGLHEGLFAGPVLRWLYFFSGLLGTAMVATGAIHWTSKRRKQASDAEQTRGFRFVEIANIGTIMGVLIGVAAFFWANRLLPVGLETRAEWEAHAIFVAWGLCLVYPMVRSPQHAWRDLTWVAAIAYGALPLLNALTTDVGLLASIDRNDWVMASFDLTALGTGVALALSAVYLTRKAAFAETPTASGAARRAEVAIQEAAVR